MKRVEYEKRRAGSRHPAQAVPHTSSGASGYQVAVAARAGRPMPIAQVPTLQRAIGNRRFCQLIQGQTLQRQAEPRVVPGDANYVYRQYPNGAIEIVEAPQGRGVGLVLTEGEAFEAIGREIGPFPGGETDAGSGSAVVPRSTEGEELRWYDKIAREANAAGERFGTMLSRGTSTVRDRLARLREWWTGFSSDREIANEEPATPAADDGFDAAAARVAMDELYDELTTLTVAVPIGENGITTEVTVTARYRNFGSNDDWLGAIAYAKDHLGGGWNFGKALTEGHGTDNVEHSSSFATAYAGKATPEQLEAAIEEAAESGELHDRLQEASNATEAQTIINDFAQQRLGLDCIGFAWKVIESVGQHDEFTPLYGNDLEDPSGVADTQALREAWIACRGMVHSATDIHDDPSTWRSMDMILDPTHIIMIYDVEETEDGQYLLETMESAGSSGVRRGHYLYEVGTMEWYTATGDGRKIARYVNSDEARVRRLENNQAVLDFLEASQ